MTSQRDLVRTVAARAGLSQDQTAHVVRLALEEVRLALATHGRVELRNLGVFTRVPRKPRLARDPRTNQPHPLPARWGIRFKPSTSLQSALEELPPPRD